MKNSILILLFLAIFSAEAGIIKQPVSQSVCSGNSARFHLKDTVTGVKSYAWQVKYNGKWVTLTAGGVYSGINIDTLTINPAQDSLNGALYRCLISMVPGATYISDSAALTVFTNSVPGSSITGTALICRGNSTTLNIIGGSLGTSGSWKWYSGSCGGTAVGAGASLTVTPATTTVYFVRAEGTCNTTACQSATITVRDTSVPATGILGTSTICLGKSSTLSVNGGSLGTSGAWKWYLGSCSGASIASGSSFTASPVLAGTYAYFVRAEGVCNTTICRSFTLTVNDTSVPAISATVTSATICRGQSTTLSRTGGSLGTGGSWKWYLGSCGGTSVATGTSLTISPAPGTYTYFVRAEGACNNTICRSVIITVNDTSVPANSITASAVSICLGKSSNLTINGGSLGTGGNWKWYSGSCSGSSISTGSTLAVSPTAAGSFTYFARAEGVCNNTACRNVTITVRDSSISANISGSKEICYTNNSTLSVNGGKLGYLAKWYWYLGSCGGTLVDSSVSSIVVSPPMPGNYTYFLQAKGFCNNTICKSIVLSVRDTSIPPSSITGNIVICRGSTTTLTVNGGKLASGASWKWYSGSCGGIVVGTGASLNVTPNTTTSYFVRAEGICNNTNCQSVTITVRDTSVPATGVMGTSTICLGKSSALTINGGSLGASASWRWYLGSCTGTSIGTGNVFTATPTLAGTYTYFLRAEGVCNTTLCRNFSLTVNDTSLPATSTTATSTTICRGQSTVLSRAGGSLGTGASWEWYSSSCTGTPVGSGSSLSVSPSTTTSYFVKAEGTCNITNCQNVTIIVRDTSLPAVVITAAASAICKGESVTLTLNGGSLGTGASWKWYSGSCGATLVGSGTSITVTPATTTTYFVRAEGACNNTSCQIFKVTINNPPKLTATNDTVCHGITAKPSISGAVSYQWRQAAGPITYIDNPTTNKPYINLNSAIVNPTVCTYIVTGTDWNRCTDSTEVKILVNPLPKVDAGSNFGICPDKKIKLTGTGAATYTWSTKSGIKLGDKDTVSVIPVSTSTYMLRGIDFKGCSNYDSILVTLFPKALANAGKDDSICSGSAITLNGSGGKDYLWTGGNLNRTDIANPTASPASSGQYVLKVTDANGCMDEDTLNISVFNKPAPVLTGKFNVCKNEQGNLYSTSKNANAFNWTILNGRIIGGQGTHAATANWSGSDSVGEIRVTEALRYYPFCSTTETKTVKIGGTLAPTPPQLVLKANKIETQILVCPNCNFEKYQWGYENKSSRIEVTSCKDIVWCKFDNIDTFTNFYWVKVGADLNCQTKAYFNAPLLLGQSNPLRTDDISVYPNPAFSAMNIHSMLPLKNIQIYNGVGMKVWVKELGASTTGDYLLDVSTFCRGMYILKVENTQGVYTRKIILE